MTLRVGLVGAGNHGARYLRHLRNDVDGLVPVACSRRDETAGRALAGELGLRWFADGEALIDDPAVQAVVVATPPSTHFRFAVHGLAAGKPLLLEKPLTGTVAEARELAELGRVHLLRLAQRLDARRRLVQNPVVEDLFLARGELDDGCWVSFEVSKYTRSRACWLEAVGEEGQLWVDDLDGEIILRRGRDQRRETVDAGAPTLPGVLAAWRDACAGIAPVPVTVTDGLRTLEMVAACYLSVAEKREVALASIGSS